MNPLPPPLQPNNYFANSLPTDSTNNSSTSSRGSTALSRNPSQSDNDFGADGNANSANESDSDFGSDFGSNFIKSSFSDFGDDPSGDTSGNLGNTNQSYASGDFGNLGTPSFHDSIKSLMSNWQNTLSSLMSKYGNGNSDAVNSDPFGDQSDDAGGVDDGSSDYIDDGGWDDGGDGGDSGDGGDGAGNGSSALGTTNSFSASPPNGSSTQLDMGPGGNTSGAQISNAGNWSRRSGKNDDPAFSSYFDPNMVNGNTIAIQGSQGSEVNDGSINSNRETGTYYYSSKKNAADGLVQSGFLYGNGRKFEVDFDELDFGNPSDTGTQQASVYIDNDKKVEAKYKASDFGFNNFSDQTMHFRAVIKVGHVSVQALNSQGNWQQITELSNGTINSGTMREADFKPFMSTWRMSGRPDDGQRHEMTGEMSFTPG